MFHQTTCADRIPVTMVDPVLKKALLSVVCVKLVTTETGVNVSEMICNTYTLYQSFDSGADRNRP